MKHLPYGRHNVTQGDIDAVRWALGQDKITQGEIGPTFELLLATYLNAEHVSVCSSGTAALTLAYDALDIGIGDEVIVPNITFAATATAALHLGATVTPVDVDSRTGLLNPTQVKRRITPRTKAVVAVHLGGQPCDMIRLRMICDNTGVALIEDASHALGANCDYPSGPGKNHDKLKVGSGLYADISTFSFHPVKHITTGEGGAVATPHETLHNRIQMARHHNIVHTGPGRYDIAQPGYNFRMPDINAALGREQLKRIHTNIDRRRYLAKAYRSCLAEMFPGVQLACEYHDSAWHLMQVCIDFDSYGIRRDDVISALYEAGICTQVHYIPLTELSFMRARTDHGASKFHAQTLSLPMFPELTDSDVIHVCSTLQRILTQ